IVAADRADRPRDAPVEAVLAQTADDDRDLISHGASPACDPNTLAPGKLRSASATELLRPRLEVSVKLVDLRIGHVAEIIASDVAHDVELAAARRHSSAHQSLERPRIVRTGDRQIRRIETRFDFAAAEGRPVAFGAIRRGHVPSASILWTEIERQLGRIFRDGLRRSVEFAGEETDPA